MTFKIITADERLREHRGIKILIVGPTGVGKTSLLRTLDPSKVLFLEAEAGDLAVQDVPVDMLRIESWEMARNLAVRIGGPNPSYPPTACYSQAHYEAAGGKLENLEKYSILVVDSITTISRLCFRWAEQQPEAFSDRTAKRDVRGAYGLHAREQIGWFNELQHIARLNIVYVGILEWVVDEFRAGSWQIQLEGARTARELPGIVDEIITMQWLNFGDNKPPTRGFVTTSPNPWGFPAKDRSGRLDQIEPPDLAKLFLKITPKQTENEND
jgi:hypothetical protein